MRNLLLTMILVGIFHSCKNPSYSIEDPSPTFITLGSHGGFTGEAITQYFFENGQCFQKSSISDTKQLSSIKRTAFRQMQHELLALDFLGTVMNEPGNMTYTIKYKTPDLEHSVAFNDVTKNAEQFLSFYKKYLRTDIE